MSDALDELLRLKVEAAGGSPEASDMLAMLLRSRLDVRDDGTVKVLNDDGGVRIGNGPAFDDMSVDEAIAEMAKAKPRLFGRRVEPEPEQPVALNPSTPPPEGETVTAREIRLARERREAAKARPELNPWRPETASVTMQVAMMARDPVRAARLKAEAGIR